MSGSAGLIPRKAENPTKIVKVQTPTASPRDYDNPALIYDQTREHMQQRNLGGAEIAMMGGRKRAFFHAHWTGTTWTLIKRIPDQEW
jgi:hypothetical protein